MTFDSVFWTALGQIIGINIILSGDNAVVIALACRNLPDRYRNKAIFAGSAGAIILRVIFSIFVVELMTFPYLKLIGGVLLLWIGVKLIVPESEHGEGLEGSSNLWGAIRTVVIADAVMSLDNVIAIAAAARGSFALLVIGLVISIPLIIVGSQLILKVLIRFPILVVAGGALLGWIAGEVMATDPVIEPWVNANAEWLHFWAKPIGAAVVVAIGKGIAWRRAATATPHEVEDLAEGERK
jgi:YjbE family integral membrane protein